MNTSVTQSPKIRKRDIVSFVFTGGELPLGISRSNHFLTTTSSASMIIAIFVMGLIWLRSSLRPAEQSAPHVHPAPRSEWQFTRHLSEGPETVHQHGHMTKHQPDDASYPSSLRWHLESQDSLIDRLKEAGCDYPSYNVSADTLVDPPEKFQKRRSRASILDKSANEKHENLIELEFNGKKKAFFKPDTGEFFHFKPWKSTHDSDDDVENERHLKETAEEKGSTYKAIGKMIAGGVSLGTGKEVETTVAEGLEKAEVKLEGSGIRHRQQPPQQCGDSLAGEVTRE